MSGGSGLAKMTVVLALCAFMLFFAYLWPFAISLGDVRAIAPGPLKGEIDRAVSRLPPGQRDSLDLPLPEVRHAGDSMFNDPVVTRGELEATRWIAENTGEGDKFVADIFGAELIMGMTTRVSTEGGDWANQLDMPTMCAHTDEIYKTADATRANELAKLENATLVFLPRRLMHDGWWLPMQEVNYSKFDDARYFAEVYRNDNVTIYRVL